MNNLFKKAAALVTSSVCMLTFVGLSSHDDTKVANAATTNPTVFSLVKDKSELTVGSTVIIVNTDKTKVLTKTADKLTNPNRYKIDGALVTSNNDIISAEDAKKGSTFVIENGDPKIANTLGFKKSTAKQYLNGYGSEEYTLKYYSKVNAGTSWNVEIDTSTYQVTMHSNANPARYVRWDETNNWFSGYKTATEQSPVYMYIEKEAQPQQLTYDSNDGTVATPETTTYTTLPTLKVLPDKDDKFFAGWFYDKEGTKEAKAGDPLTKATTLYAKWEEFRTVTFHYENGITDPVVINKLKDGATIDRANVPDGKKEGYEFDKWMIGPEKTKQFIFGKGNSSTRINSNLDVYATYKQKLTVKFYDSTASDATVIHTDNIVAGESVTAQPAPTLASDKLFIHWYEKGQDENIAFDFTQGISKNLELLPKTINKPTISLDIPEEKSIEVNQEIVVTATATDSATDVKWTVINDDGAINSIEQGNKITLTGLKPGAAMITATVSDQLGGSYEASSFISVILNELQKTAIAPKYNLGATYTLIDEGPERLEKVTGLLEGEYLNGKYVIVSETANAALDGSKTGTGEIFKDAFKYVTLDAESLKPYAFTITHKTIEGKEGYSLEGSSGVYFVPSDKKSDSSNVEDKSVLTNISFDTNGDVIIHGTGTQKLICNPNNGSPLFRFYDSLNGGASLQLYKLTGGVQFTVSEARAKFAFTLPTNFVNDNNVTEVGVRIGKDIANIDKWEKCNLTGTNNNGTYTVSVKYTNVADFAKPVYVIPYYVVDGKTYDFYPADETLANYYSFSVEDIAKAYENKLEKPEDNAFLTRLIDLIAKNK